MDGFDFILEKKKSLSEIKKALSISLDMVETDILITTDYVDYTLSKNIKLWCIVNEISGEFSLICQIYIRDKNIKNTQLDIVKRICSVLNLSCLISNNNLDPFSWDMIFPSGIIKSISLNPDDMNNDIYTLSKK